jgi:acetyl-CoA carboxylase biotin carboxylase subunit
MTDISRVLIANRGEIAVRIIRACQDLGIETVVAVSEADRESLAAKMADRAVCIGPAAPLKSYLSVGTIITAARGVGANAVHPGYGFLAEQPELGEACAECGLIFVGPKPDSIKKMGDKLVARKTARDIGIPVIPGTELIHSVEAAATMADGVGYPVLLKAAAGGGGKGMKSAGCSEELKKVYTEASAEALGAFGDDRLYMEHFIPNARHIEIQILADRFGNTVHLFERDCSLQRRYQKMIEEAPSPVVSEEMRGKIVEAAIRIADHIGYENAGTIEFIYDQHQERFYFLEMNTRIQVEHPVTEMITGVDLVKEQIRIAEGKPLSTTQKQVKMTGHAIECRINAEAPEDNFRPVPGRITQWQAPEGKDIRVDTHCFPGYMVPPFYDSLLAKIIVAGNSRRDAIESMRSALNHFAVSGVTTNIQFLASLISHADFVTGNISTRWLEQVVCSKGDNEK